MFLFFFHFSRWIGTRRHRSDREISQDKRRRLPASLRTLIKTPVYSEDHLLYRFWSSLQFISSMSTIAWSFIVPVNLERSRHSEEIRLFESLLSPEHNKHFVLVKQNRSFLENIFLFITEQTDTWRIRQFPLWQLSDKQTSIWWCFCFSLGIISMIVYVRIFSFDSNRKPSLVPVLISRHAIFR